MILSPIERHLLINQYEILKRLDRCHHGECKNYDMLLSLLHSGYDDDFVELLTRNEPPPLSEDVQREVREIIHMFQLLGPLNETPAANFAGFSRDDEAEHYDYAMFVLEESVDILAPWSFDYDTRDRALPAYRVMLQEWQASHDPENLTEDDVRRINAKGKWSTQPSRRAQGGGTEYKPERTL